MQPHTVPFFELFRLLPWRKEILEGMLGADLIGFHAYDYTRHFNSCERDMMDIKTIQIKYISKKMNDETLSATQKDFSDAGKSILFLDCNGTRVNKDDIAEYASPDKDL